MNMIVLPYLVDFALGRAGEGHAVVLELDDCCRRFLGHVVDSILLEVKKLNEAPCSSDIPHPSLRSPLAFRRPCIVHARISVLSRSHIHITITSHS